MMYFLDLLRKIAPLWLKEDAKTKKIYSASRNLGYGLITRYERVLCNISYWIVRRRIKGKKNISVGFVLLNADTWKLDALYSELERHERFTPVVIIAPFVTKGPAFLRQQLGQCTQLCEKRNYSYLVGFDTRTNEPINLQRNAAFDIVFFTNPNALSSHEYSIQGFKNSLVCYVPYSFRIDKLHGYDFNNRLVNLTWMNFWETEYHKELSERHALNHGINVEVTGYPQIDIFLKGKGEIALQYDKRKKIIWAPHWTIPGLQNTTLDWSCFLDFESVFLELADKWEEEVEFILKPHPFLFNLLENTSWGEEKVSGYIKEWERRDNCSIVSGDYTDLFLASDALIHDSGSFLVEYLALDRPVAYTLSTHDLLDRFNAVGKEAFAAHYNISGREDLSLFLESVINGSDSGVEKRLAFRDKYFNHGSASTKIVSVLSSNI